MFLLGLGSWINIYQSNNINNKSHKVKQNNIKRNTIICEVFQKVFVGSEFWALLISYYKFGMLQILPPLK